MLRRDRSRNPAPELGRELAALDAALEGRTGPGDELDDLVAAVREERPLPAATWAHDLDHQVAARFGQATAGRRHRSSLPAPLGRIRGWLRSGSRWRLLAPAAATLVPLLLVAVVLGARSGSPGAPTPAETAAPAQLSAPAPPSGTAASRGSAPTGQLRRAPAVPGPSPGATSLDLGKTRRVHRTVAVALAPPASHIADTADGVVRVTDAFGGIVQSSSVNTADGGQGGASFDLRLPADRLGAALDALSRLAHVRSRSDQSEDITKPFDDASAAVVDATAARDSLRRQLAGASTPQAAASLRATLAGAEGRVRAATAQLASLRRASDLVAVSVDIEPAGGSAAAPPAGTWTLGDAAAQALRILAGAAGVLLIALAVALPIGAAAALGVLVARIWRQRARERALGAGA